jgi:hypothetical protein
MKATETALIGAASTKIFVKTLALAEEEQQR